MIVLAGDVHGALDDLANKVAQYNPRLILQAGDLGLFESEDSFDSKTRKRFKRNQETADKIKQAFPYAKGEKSFPYPLYFVRGNHEDYNLLDRMEHEENDFWQTKNFNYVGTSVHFPLDMVIAFLGGIYYQGNNEQRALKRKYTQPEEFEELMDITSDLKVEILLTHDCPRNAFPDSDLKMPHGSPYVTKFIKERKPKYLIHGHYHRIRRQYTIRDTHCIALGKEDVVGWQKPLDLSLEI